MNGRITTRVLATDPITSVGVAGILRGRPEIALVEGHDADNAQVTVAAGHELDDELARMIRSVQCNGCQRVVLLLTRVDDRAVASCVELGVRGILRWTEATAERIVAAVRAAAVGEATLAPDLVARLLEHVGMLSRRVLAPQGVGLSGLTDREVEVLRLLADGHDTADIAAELAYSERTVKTVIHDITSRLRLKNRSHAVAYALRQGLI
jgi:DNA-binding NarL/FixJ family response regulator